MDLVGKTVLVTGGASGLGEATARYFVGQGSNVVVFDRDVERGKAIESELGGKVVFVAGSVLDDDDTQAAVAAATDLGGLRGVVACAGGARNSARTIGRDGTPHDRDLFTDTVDLNLVGTFNTLRFAASAMNELEPVDDDGQRGAVVMVASIAGYEGQIGQLAYGAAKAGIIGMTLIAARDLASSGIRVSAIAPGTIHTRAWEQASPEMRKTFEDKVPFPKRFGRPDEFAQLAEHLLTNDYLNGHVARIDGAIRFDPK
jgi:NAD(P)-dependent dehydrogenase (short-subunit alcohol dehydrogenase family)